MSLGRRLRCRGVGALCFWPPNQPEPQGTRGDWTIDKTTRRITRSFGVWCLLRDDMLGTPTWDGSW